MFQLQTLLSCLDEIIDGYPLEGVVLVSGLYGQPMIQDVLCPPNSVYFMPKTTYWYAPN